MTKQNRKLSLYPLNFNEALTDVLKIKPEPRPPKVANTKPRPKLKQKEKAHSG